MFLCVKTSSDKNVSLVEPSFVIKELMSEAKATAKANDTKLFQSQLQVQAEIRIATNK